MPVVPIKADTSVAPAVLPLVGAAALAAMTASAGDWAASSTGLALVARTCAQLLPLQAWATGLVQTWLKMAVQGVLSTSKLQLAPKALAPTA